MKKLNFFWRTVMITTTAIILTVVVVVSTIFVSTNYVSKYIAKQNFQKDAGKIIEHIQKNGIDEEYLEQPEFFNYSVMIYTEKEIVYPPAIFMDSTVAASTDIASVIIAPTMPRELAVQFNQESFSEVQEVTTINGIESTTLVPEASEDAHTTAFISGEVARFEQGTEDISITQALIDYQLDFTRQEEVTIDGVNYTLSISDIAALYNTDSMVPVVIKSIPYYLIGGLAVSFLVSIFYAKFYTKKILHLSTVVEDMEVRKMIETPKRISGDELQELENGLYDMYDSLQKTMFELDEEITYTKRLEEDKQIFMRGATHELKTPIMTMSVMLEGMLENFGEYENHDIYLRKSLATLHVMEKLVNEILAVSKLEHVSFDGETDLVKEIEKVLELQEALIEEKVLTIEKDYMSGDHKLAMDEKSLNKIISNIIGNSIRYSPSGSNIKIQVTDECLLISNQIEDCIDEALEKLKEPFVTTASGGHGLGLYIVDMLLQRYELPYEYLISEQSEAFEFYIYF